MTFIVKNTTLPSLSDVIAPHICRGCGAVGSVLCKRCKNHIIETHADICPECKKPKTKPTCPDCNLPVTFCIGERNDLLDELIHDFKYNSIRPIGKAFVDILDKILPTLPEKTIIIPLPTSNKHIRQRGIDHTLYITKRLAKKRHLKFEKILIRAKDTVQVGANHTSRIAQANQAYAINSKTNINPDYTYILFDDVWTTGASMKSAIKKLQMAGAKNIRVVLLAVSKLSH